MDMTDSSPTAGAMAMMTPYLHFTGGDVLFFKSLTPTSGGAIAGACIALALLAIFERILSAARGTMEAQWKQQVLAMTASRLGGGASSPDESVQSKDGDVSEDTRASGPPSAVPVLPDRQRSSLRRARIIAPFIASHDIPRGTLYAVQALLAYILMLAVMTFQAAYIIAIVAGLGLGEMLFGRFAVGH